jgi:hypothetical protein
MVNQILSRAVHFTGISKSRGVQSLLIVTTTACWSQSARLPHREATAAIALRRPVQADRTRISQLRVGDDVRRGTSGDSCLGKCGSARRTEDAPWAKLYQRRPVHAGLVLPKVGDRSKPVTQGNGALIPVRTPEYRQSFGRNQPLILPSSSSARPCGLRHLPSSVRSAGHGIRGGRRTSGRKDIDIGAAEGPCEMVGP